MKIDKGEHKPVGSTVDAAPSGSVREALLSANFLYTVIVLAMLNNLEHSAEVYHDVMRTTLPNALRWIVAILAVCIIDLAVLAFVVRKKHLLAGFYAAGMFLINMVYHFDAIPEIYAKGLASVVFSLMTTHSIYAFSRILADAGSTVDSPRDQNTAEKPAVHTVKKPETSIPIKSVKKNTAKRNGHRSNGEVKIKAVKLKEQDKTTAEISEQLGVSERTVRRYLNGSAK